MPSIPQSLLWISLVVLWLFVLVPMLVSKRDAVRRTSDVALATRVLNGGANSRLIKRNGPAAGHRSDPDWKPPGGWAPARCRGASMSHSSYGSREPGAAIQVMALACSQPRDHGWLDNRLQASVPYPAATGIPLYSAARRCGRPRATCPDRPWPSGGSLAVRADAGQRRARWPRSVR